MYIELLSSSGGTDDLDCGEMNFFKVDHQSFEESDSDLILSASLSRKAFLHLRIVLTTLFRTFLNFCQSISKPVDLAFRYALLRLRIFRFISVVIHGGSEGRIVICLFGIHSFAIDKIVDVMFSEYVLTLLS